MIHRSIPTAAWPALLILGAAACQGCVTPLLFSESHTITEEAAVAAIRSVDVGDAKAGGAGWIRLRTDPIGTEFSDLRNAGKLAEDPASIELELSATAVDRIVALLSDRDPSPAEAPIVRMSLRYHVEIREDSPNPTVRRGVQLEVQTGDSPETFHGSLAERRPPLCDETVIHARGSFRLIEVRHEIRPALPTGARILLFPFALAADVTIGAAVAIAEICRCCCER